MKKMMKLLKLACLSALALAAVHADARPSRVRHGAAGYGKNVAVPEDALVAVYVDFGKTYKRGTDVAKTLIRALPDEERTEANGQFENVVAFIDKVNDALEPEWLLLTFGGDLENIDEHSAKEHIVSVARVHTSEHTLSALLNDIFNGLEITAEKRAGGVVFNLPGNRHYGLVDGKYLIYCMSEDVFSDVFDMYAGRGEASKEFSDLADIPDNAVCRIMTAPVGKVLERFGVRPIIENFGAASKDQDLANMILNMGSISLDVGAGDELSLSLQVACNSSSDAKVIEGLMRSVAFLARLGCDTGAFAAVNPDVFGGIDRSDLNMLVAGRDILINLARDFEVDRGGSVATFSCKLRTERIAEFITRMASLSSNDWEDDKRADVAQKDEPKKEGYHGYRREKKVVDAKDDKAGEPRKYDGYTTPRKSEEAAKDVKKEDAKAVQEDDNGAVQSFWSYRRNAKKATCLSNMKQLQTAAEMYMLNHGTPPSLDDLCGLGPDKYLKTKPTCPLDGSSYRVSYEDGEFKVTCPNADKGHVFPNCN